MCQQAGQEQPAGKRRRPAASHRTSPDLKIAPRAAVHGHTSFPAGWTSVAPRQPRSVRTICSFYFCSPKKMLPAALAGVEEIAHPTSGPPRQPVSTGTQESPLVSPLPRGLACCPEAAQARKTNQMWGALFGGRLLRGWGVRGAGKAAKQHSKGGFIATSSQHSVPDVKGHLALDCLGRGAKKLKWFTPGFNMRSPLTIWGGDRPPPPSKGQQPP